ncbi:hypothetical protein OQX61_10075 [Pedobacter sp. PLR]|uniref:hypothetical protein n=1 Tax=Pedobacter sp. PLR TaxID=2994465 RepID=UPI002246E1A6|nr:hypothetical protein [Pedobacter sp. PLR]MCX2451609.1 hypothetical protein [Pedobacter sp. PLR]
MNNKFLAVLLVIATAFIACKKDKVQEPEENVLPTGKYRLIEMMQSNAEGKDSVSVKYPLSSLSLTFDQDKKTANVSGKPEFLQMTGSYKVSADGRLTDGKVSTSKGVPGENDLNVADFLAIGEKYELKGGSVVVHTRNKGYLVFSMQK